ncbi:hypothetical protein MPDQ_007299 [Monascus purpureus]|uniref:Zn(2)-C6 fungal-type domain-containing protein n=1 Tax=Monascus purpureus TaxID=5098 RepID=A0A507QUK4_MONPU|nr:hypothetical protein MPDQ_007299 [Monascus purpureus]
MSRFDDQSLSLQPLPKSVKVRSTCNACQQAKIRCGHEKPSCRRCQKQNIECIYSMSRRLGRPAKKRDLDDDSSRRACPGRRNEKKPRGPKKRARDNENESNHDQAAEKHVDEAAEDGDSTSIEESLQPPIIPESIDPNPGPISVAENLDFSPDSWLQDLVLTQMPEDSTPFDAFDGGFSKDPTSSLLPEAGTVPDGYENTPSSYFALDNGFRSHQALAMGYNHNSTNHRSSTVNTPNLVPEYRDWKDSRFLPKSEPVVDGLCQSLSSSIDKAHCDYDDDYSLLPFESMPLERTPPLAPPPQLDVPSVFNCQCYGLASRELLQIQLGLQHLADTVLQCGICSKTQANLLMIIVVCVDSLIAMLETTVFTRSSRSLGLGLLGVDLENHTDDGFANAAIGREGCSNGSSHTGPFKSQINTCPLLVGNFRVPLDEKNSFIRQVLHARLSILLATVRKIRQCMQQMLAASSSRGRLIMIMETDRRVQLVMMKIKMLG